MSKIDAIKSRKGMLWCGKPVEELTKEELIEALYVMAEREEHSYVMRNEERKMRETMHKAMFGR